MGKKAWGWKKVRENSGKWGWEGRRRISILERERRNITGKKWEM